MSTNTRLYDRVLAMFLAVILVVAMLPISTLQATAASVDYPDEFTVTVSDENGALISGAAIDYTINVNGVESSSGTATAENGVAIIADVKTLDFSGNSITISATISKNGYETKSVTDEVITSATEDLPVTLKELDKVTIGCTVKDEAGELVEGATIAVTGYTEDQKTTVAGICELNLYKDQNYSISVSKEGYIGTTEVDLVFTENGDKEFTITAKAVDDSFAFTNTAPEEGLPYGQTFTNIAESSLRTGHITYSISDGDAVTINPTTGELTAVKVGTATIKATMAEDDTYQKSEASYTITVVTAEDSGFEFATSGPVNVTYSEGGTYINTAEGGKGTGTVKYEIIEGNEFASIDEQTGKVTFIMAGTVIVKATREADEKYSKVECIYQLNIGKANQSGFKFEIENPENQFITNGIFTNIASGGEGSGKVTYEITEGSEYATVDENGVVSFIKVGGPITVVATKAADDKYEKATCQYFLSIKKSPQPEFGFEKDAVQPITYSPNGTFENKIDKYYGSGKITYSIEGDAATIDPNTGVLTIVKAGTVTVKAHIEADSMYLEDDAEYTLTINKAQQTGFAFENNGTAGIVDKTWNPDANTFTNIASGGQSAGAITYKFVSIDDMMFGGPCASFNADTATVTMYGGGSIKIKAVKAGDDCYEPVEAEYTLRIGCAEQEALTFAPETPTSVTYNENNNEYSLNVLGGSGNGKVTFNRISGDAATISSDGVLSVAKAGTVVIRATKAGTNSYKEQSVDITITILKASQTIEFADKSTSEIKYGNTFTNVASPVVNPDVPDKMGYAPLTKIEYEVIEGKNIAAVNSDGTLIFKDQGVGKVTVKATKAGDDCYEATSSVYTLNVVYLGAPETPYTLSGATKNESGWYTGDVTITPAEGYQISYSNNLASNEWLPKIEIGTEGIANGKTIYLKNADGITDGITISANDIRIDKKAPETSKMKISYSKSVIDTILEGVTFGFYKAPVTVTLEAYDDNSTIESFKYSYTVSDRESATNVGESNITIPKEKITFSDDKKTATASFPISAQFRGKVSFTATDIAGNESGLKADSKVIVVDSVTEGVTVSFDNNSYSNDTFYNAGRVATITISESNFFPQAFDKVEDISVDPSKMIDEHLVITVIKVLNDGTKTETVFKNDDLTTGFKEIEGTDTWQATLAFTDDADYTLSITYKDFSGNEAEPYSTHFTIDTKKPELSFDRSAFTANNANHYGSEIKPVLTIVEHNFDPSNICIEGNFGFEGQKYIAVDVQGNPVTLTRDYQEFLRNGEWSSDGDVHTLEVPFDQNAHYNFKITYTDLAANTEVTPVVDEFYVTLAAPQNLSVSYSKSVMDAVIEAITFGFYDAPVTVTITADDSISGVDYFTYSYTVSKGESEINSGEKDVVIPFKDIKFDGKTATATFTIPEQFRGNVSFTATNKAGHTSNEFKDGKVIVVDKVAPGVTVKYNNTNAANNTYYNEKRVATITIDEANFFPESFEKIENVAVDPAVLIDEHLIITVGKKLNNESAYTEKIIKNADLTTGFKKVKIDGKDQWQATLEFAENADYTFKIEYKDFSGNEMKGGTFTDAFTVDLINPELSISHGESKPLNNNYYGSNITSTITIVEHNFDPSTIVVEGKYETDGQMYIAVDVQGNPVTLTRDFQDFLRKGEWSRDGDVYSIDVPFDVDARYGFIIKANDLAGREQEAVINDEFIVDNGNPDNLTISYSKSVLDVIFEAVTFGFYKAPVKVTITSDDAVAGIDYVTYSYIVSDGVSSTNTGKESVKVVREDLTFSNSQKTATVSFEIPAQFRGKVSFVATDMAGHSTQRSDNKEIVVDNDLPGISVVYDNNDASYSTYYKAPRTATITIDEANFFLDAFDKLQDVSVDPISVIDEHLIITVGKQLNDQSRFTETVYKNADLTTGFKKIDGKDQWQATLEFAEDADYSLKIEYKDFSGNPAGTFNDAFTVDNINPHITVSYNDASALYANGNQFRTDREATIVIEEHNFKPSDVVASIVSESADGQVEDYAAYLASEEAWTSDGDTHTAKIGFNVNANYTFAITYKDMAGRDNDPVDYGSSVSPTAFTVDKIVPTGTIKVDDWAISKDGRDWAKPIDGNTAYSFELWTNKSAVVDASSADNLSGIDYVEHFKSSEGLSLDEVKSNTTWIRATGSSFNYTVSPDERFIVYVHIVDKAGNEIYLSTDGIIVDETLPDVEKVAPEVTVTPTVQPVNGIYNTDVLMDVVVRDPADPSDNTLYSGLSLITYKVFNKSANETQPTQQGVLFDFTNTDLTLDSHGLIQLFQKNACITVDKEANNSNEIVVEITATDNAGNTSIKTCELKIDITAPSIDISYSNNTADNEKYFKEDRTATIVVTERNFDPSKVLITITNTDGVIPSIGEWVNTNGTGNLDDTKWTNTITYDADGDYTFDVAYSDQADNVCAGAQYGDSVAPTEFTLDKTLPTITVSYNNNTALNGKYFKASRVATIVVNEHNFDVNRVKFTQTASLNGTEIAIPNANWSHDGDIHTATIEYSADGDYTFDVSVLDIAANESEAANYGDSVAAKDFVVDQTIVKPTIGGVENGKAYKDNVVPTISFEDVNYASYEVKLFRTRKGDKNVDVTAEYIKSVTEKVQGGSGSYDTFERIADNDGIYMLTVKMLDKAGNEETQSINFTVNRFGSVYEYSDYLVSLIQNGGAYVGSITDDLILTEYNADRLVGGSLVIEITCDGKPLDNVVFEVSPEINDKVETGESGWFQYRYTISKDNFKNDGVYKVSISSKDATGNTPENSNYDDKNILFRVDSTVPEITSIVGLEESIINAQDVTVKYTVFDNIGLKSIKIFVDGKQVGEEITDFGGDLNNYNGSFVIRENSVAQTVQIVVEDLSGNVTDTNSDNFSSAYAFNKSVTVSTNIFVRWYANKPLFWGSIGGVVVLVAGLWIAIAALRKKKNKETK